LNNNATVKELNNIAWETLTAHLETSKFESSRYGVHTVLHCSPLSVTYHIILPHAGLMERPFFREDGRVSLLLGVQCREIEDIIRSMVPAEVNFGDFTFVTSTDMLFRMPMAVNSLKGELSIERCHYLVDTIFDHLINKGEAVICNLCKPGNLLKALQKPEKIYMTSTLGLREIALLLYLNRVEDTVFALNMLSGGDTEINLTTAHIEAIKTYIKRWNNGNKSQSV